MIATIQTIISRNKLKYNSYVPDSVVTVKEENVNPEENEIFYKAAVELLNSMFHNK